MHGHGGERILCFDEGMQGRKLNGCSGAPAPSECKEWVQTSKLINIFTPSPD